MCGLLAIVTDAGGRVELDDDACLGLRDMMVHRGPDDAGFWRAEHAVLAHRRLAVIDPSAAGRQPMQTPDGRLVLVYNGELYNDAELRSELATLGVRFRTSCDAETVLHAVAAWGDAAFDRFRGMYAVAALDLERHALLLARDPLGVKPLYWHRRERRDGRTELIVASEVRPIVEHPDVDPRPDLEVVSAYLTTIRPELGARTLFAGVETLRPGERIAVDLAASGLPATRSDWWDRGPIAVPTDEREAVSLVGGVVGESVVRHLRSDVPFCALLSGGLDSSAICAVTRDKLDVFETFCAGAPGGADSEDFGFASTVAATLGTVHTDVAVTRELFARRWPEMVADLGIPLSTPNEVAIDAVARVCKRQGNTVVLSGEGADELFGGYEHPMRQAAAYVASLEGGPDVHGGHFQLVANQWVALEVKSRVLVPEVAQAIEGDAALIAVYDDAFATERERAPADTPLQAHLRFHRRINLANLLRRLDGATMQASVEGRTPMSDQDVAQLAEALPMTLKYHPEAGDGWTTKRALRAAFAERLPPAVIARPKASFPLPFPGWMTDHAGVLRESAFARALFTAEAIDTVTAEPERHWLLAWPMINVAMWGRRWWG